MATVRLLVSERQPDIRALFSWQKFLVLGTVSLSFVCVKYCPIID